MLWGDDRRDRRQEKHHWQTLKTNVLSQNHQFFSVVLGLASLAYLLKKGPPDQNTQLGIVSQFIQGTRKRNLITDSYTSHAAKARLEHLDPCIRSMLIKDQREDNLSLLIQRAFITLNCLNNTPIKNQQETEYYFEQNKSLTHQNLKILIPARSLKSI